MARSAEEQSCLFLNLNFPTLLPVQEGQGPIRALAEQGPSVQHNFAAACLCVVPLRLHLRNCLPHPASLSVEAGRMQAQALPSSKLRPLCNCALVLSGHCHPVFHAVLPYEQLTRRFNALRPP